MSKYLCADCVLREQCDCEWTMRCASYVPKEYKQTNEEWIKQCNTEQLAETLFREYYNGRNDATTGDWEGVDTYVEWLKQPHTTE